MTVIKYPQVCNHKSKDGKNSCPDYSLDDVSDKKIGETVVGANLAAKISVESLGMADLLQEHNYGTPFLSLVQILSLMQEILILTWIPMKGVSSTEVLVKLTVQEVSTEYS